MEGLEEFLQFSSSANVVGREIIVDGAETWDVNRVLSPLQLTNNQYVWNRPQTLKLIDCFKTAKARVGSHIITKKKLWVLVAELFGEGITPSNCENRWKVLERNFKAVMDNKTKTGRGRKTFEFLAEMEEIFGKKKNINPTLVLNSDTTHFPTFSQPASSAEMDDEGLQPTVPQQPTPSATKGKTRNRFNVLDAFRIDKKKYHEQMIAIHKERLEVEKERLAALREKNRILSENKCSCNGNNN